ncbi:hypothetical protein GCM10010289_84170 [Streptomyces violascens]|nr:hypothetical protein GCM10010289_84170 [Streptomyces violascens]
MLLERTSVWDQRYLLYALREFETFYTEYGPHQGLANARPLHRRPLRSRPRTGSPT